MNSIDMGEEGNNMLDEWFNDEMGSDYSGDDMEEDAAEDVDVGEEDDLVYGTDCVVDKDDHNSKRWIPLLPVKEKPFVGRKFKSMDEGEQFYYDYAKYAGFQVRKGTIHNLPHSTILKMRYLYCNRKGEKNTGNSTGKRKTTTNRVECEAMLKINWQVGDVYVVAKFIEPHNHDMVPDTARQFMKCNRRLEDGHKKFMLSCAKANLGPVKSYKLLKEMVGGFGLVNALANDFKNFKRDLMKGINKADAQMVINRFIKKKENCSGFYFEYAVDKDNRLTRLFWADPISRRNYAAFGDVVSFDSTYRTNRYNMVFAPFTGVDNHKKSLTLGAGLVMKEDTAGYNWLFEHFLKAMGHAPKIIVTDQDPAMKVAIVETLPNTRHRLCMWHIMEKVSTKVGAKKINSKDFRKRLGSLVWDDTLTIDEFESEWHSFMEDEDLKDKARKWFNDMYNLRRYWIPAYFKDIVLGGLVRTTSISESQNSFFGTYINRDFILVELMMHFESAVETQRHKQLRNDYDSDTRKHQLNTQLSIERHASEVYTLNFFNILQKEIDSACFCCILTPIRPADLVDVEPDTNALYYNIKVDGGEFEVVHKSDVDITTCSCMLFNKIGLPCRHILATLNYRDLKELPNNLVLNRWTKAAVKNAKSGIPNVLWNDSVEIQEKKALMNEVWSVIYNCVGLVEDDVGKLKDLLKTLNEKKEFYTDPNGENDTNVRVTGSMIKSFAGVDVPEEIEVQVPGIAINKGTGRDKRIRSIKEKTQEKGRVKGTRKCARCKKYTNHDKRNCKEILPDDDDDDDYDDDE